MQAGGPLYNAMLSANEHSRTLVDTVAGGRCYGFHWTVDSALIETFPTLHHQPHPHPCHTQQERKMAFARPSDMDALRHVLLRIFVSCLDFV